MMLCECKTPCNNKQLSDEEWRYLRNTFPERERLSHRIRHKHCNAPDQGFERVSETENCVLWRKKAMSDNRQTGNYKVGHFYEVNGVAREMTGFESCRHVCRNGGEKCPGIAIFDSGAIISCGQFDGRQGFPEIKKEDKMKGKPTREDLTAGENRWQGHTENPEWEARDYPKINDLDKYIKCCPFCTYHDSDGRQECLNCPLKIKFGLTCYQSGSPYRLWLKTPETNHPKRSFHASQITMVFAEEREKLDEEEKAKEAEKKHVFRVWEEGARSEPGEKTTWLRLKEFHNPFFMSLRAVDERGDCLAAGRFLNILDEGEGLVLRLVGGVSSELGLELDHGCRIKISD